MVSRYTGNSPSVASDHRAMSPSRVSGTHASRSSTWRQVRTLSRILRRLGASLHGSPLSERHLSQNSSVPSVASSAIPCAEEAPQFRLVMAGITSVVIFAAVVAIAVVLVVYASRALAASKGTGSNLPPE